MTEKPLLRLPTPRRKQYVSMKASFGGNINFPSQDEQSAYFEPRFRRLSRTLDDPMKLKEWTHDPASIAPERALVFEIAGSGLDFASASRRVEGLEFLGEDAYSRAPVREFRNVKDPAKDITLNVYLTMPDTEALRKLLSLWELYKSGQGFQTGYKQWRKIFNSLVDIRPWGPNDRLAQYTVDNWKYQLEQAPETPIKLEAEFWYRKSSTQREQAHQRLRTIVSEAKGEIIDQSTISEIQYDAALVQVPPEFIHEIIKDPKIKLVEFSDIMYLLPQATFRDELVQASENTLALKLKEPSHLEHSEEVDTEVVRALSTTGNSETLSIPGLAMGRTVRSQPSETITSEGKDREPIVALLDGLPMANHSKLVNRLEIDDPDAYSEKYGRINFLQHGTSMASAIIHGDLNSTPSNSPISSKLYVRPVLYPIPYGFEGDQTSLEQIPDDRLILDLTWQCFKRMFEGENQDDPVAPTIKIVNISLGNEKRRFHNTMSPWAKLLDYVAWKHKVLILISAGNVTDEIPLDEVERMSELDMAGPTERAAIVIKGLLRRRSARTLLSPSESVNAITVGARHFDEVVPAGSIGSKVDPFGSSFLPNTSSALGLGYLRSVKPDILMPGGRELVESNSDGRPLLVSPTPTMSRIFGIGVAAPDQSGDTARERNYSGTSVATALATHNSVKIIEELKNCPDEPVYPDVPEEFTSVVAKTLLVHSARWDSDLATKIANLSENLGTRHWEHQREDVSRLLGFGAVDTDRLFECSDKRATLIGWGSGVSKQTEEYALPLPSQLENVSGYRAITITVGWFTPINPHHRKYWMTKFRVVPIGEKNLPIGLPPSRTQPSHHAVQKGTIFHRRWEGKKASAFIANGELTFDLICEPTTGSLDMDIPYGIAVTIEVDQKVDIPVYNEVRNRLHQMVKPPIRP